MHGEGWFLCIHAWLHNNYGGKRLSIYRYHTYGYKYIIIMAGVHGVA